jgi:molecular chaperone GrpE (heat shock protein)
MEKKEELELIDRIKKLYLEEKKSFPQIGNELGMTVGNIHYCLKKHGVSTRGPKEGWKTRFPNGRFGDDAGHWKGGRVKAGGGRGYMTIHRPDHPHATKKGYVMEHRLVMEEKLGRILKPKEIVHHINGDSFDNRPENLEVQDRSTHVHNHFAHGKNVMKLEEENRKLKDRIRELEAELFPLRKRP